MNILINGAGVAGPTLAYWLMRYGHRPTLVETAPKPRTGGYIIDFWGVGYDVADKMGLVPALQTNGYRLQELRLVDAAGRKSGGFSAEVFSRATKGRYVSLPRSVLAETILKALDDDTETLFDEEIKALDATPDGVRAHFRHASARDFDLVIGAGGLHSKVRALCFGEEQQFSDYLGYKVAAFEARDYPRRDELVYVSYASPGQQAARFALRNDNTLILLVMDDSDPSLPEGADAERAYVHRRFDNAGWECAGMMQVMDASETVYFDNVSQIHMPAWSNDRVALVGDAAACPSLLAGEGASLAMAEAFVLAGELHNARGDHRLAFARYETLMRPFLARKQRAARRFATSFAPKTRFGIAVRNLVTRAMGLPFVADLALGQSVRDDFELPAYA